MVFAITSKIIILLIKLIHNLQLSVVSKHRG